MNLDKVREACLQEAANEYGANNNKYQIVAQSLETGVEHIQAVCADFNGDEKLTRRQMNKNRRAAREKAYQYLQKNTPATAETVGMGVIEAWVFWFVAKQVLWWLAGKLLNWWLFDDEGDDD